MNEAIRNNPILALMLTLVMAVGGSTGLQVTWKDVRSDPFTGQEGNALKDWIAQVDDNAQKRHGELLKMIDAQAEQIRALTVQQALDNQHRKDAVDGYLRIRVLEAGMAKMTQAQIDTKEEIRLLREELREEWRRKGN